MMVDKLEFEASAGNPCFFYLQARDLRVVVHGDNITGEGEEEELEWLEAELSVEWLIVREAMIGPEADDTKEATTLNRVMRFTSEGVELEGDIRHAEILIAEMGLTERGKGVSTPGSRETFKEAFENQVPLEQVGAKTAVRSSASRGIYYSYDRPDLSYSAKEAARGCETPTTFDAAKLKRQARYLKARPRLVQKFPWQAPATRLECKVDTDLAGSLGSVKSTNGGVILLGLSVLLWWATTQSLIADSSGVAEFYGSLKGAKELLGVTAS